MKILVWWALAAFAAQAGEFPFKDPWLATISSALLKANEKEPSISYKDYSIKLLPHRDSVPFYGSERNKIFSRFWRAPNADAPLLILVSGLGGASSANYFNFLSYHFVKKGFHTLTVSSPFHFSFSLAASGSGYPGHTLEDAKDLQILIDMTTEKVRRKEGLALTRRSLLGVSMGALEAAYLADLDKKSGKNSYEKVLLINPPVNVLSSANALHALRVTQVSGDQKKSLKMQSLELGMQTLISGDITNPNYFAPLHTFKATEEEKKYLIGQSMQDFLEALIFTTQEIDDLRILKPGSAEERLNQAKEFSLHDYLEKFFLPGKSKLFGRTITYKDIENEVNLFGVEENLRNDSRVLLMHNQDDFIVTSEELAWVKQTMGERAKIYPNGGHVGNIWFEENLATILGWFTL